MASMAEKMRKKAIKATNTTKSTKVVKYIERCDVVALNRTMELTIAQNERERRENWEAVKDEYIGTK